MAEGLTVACRGRMLKSSAGTASRLANAVTVKVVVIVATVDFVVVLQGMVNLKEYDLGRKAGLHCSRCHGRLEVGCAICRAMS